MKKFNTLTGTIQRNISNKYINVLDRVPAIVASLFSILFALSITIELHNLISGIVLTFLIVFIILFLVLNEVIKVKMIRSLFNGIKTSIIPFIITFLLSCGLSGIGIYFWTNKSIQIKDNSILVKSISINDIKQKYNTNILDINNKTFEETEEFKVLNKDINFWTTRRAANVKERADIRIKIDIIQNTIIKQRNVYNKNKQLSIEQVNELMIQEMNIVDVKYNASTNKMNRNNFVSYIFFTLIIITEFAIIILNKILVEKENKLTEFLNSDKVKNYLQQRNILISLFMVKDEDNRVNLNKAKYSPANINNVLEWSELTAMYNNFISLGILIDSKVEDNILTNKINLTETDALKQFDLYFEKYFKFSC